MTIPLHALRGLVCPPIHPRLSQVELAAISAWGSHLQRIQPPLNDDDLLGLAREASEVGVTNTWASGVDNHWFAETWAGFLGFLHQVCLDVGSAHIQRHDLHTLTQEGRSLRDYADAFLDLLPGLGWSSGDAAIRFLHGLSPPNQKILSCFQFRDVFHLIGEAQRIGEYVADLDNFERLGLLDSTTPPADRASINLRPHSFRTAPRSPPHSPASSVDGGEIRLRNPWHGLQSRRNPAVILATRAQNIRHANYRYDSWPAPPRPPHLQQWGSLKREAPGDLEAAAVWFPRGASGSRPASPVPMKSTLSAADPLPEPGWAPDSMGAALARSGSPVPWVPVLPSAGPPPPPFLGWEPDSMGAALARSGAPVPWVPILPAANPPPLPGPGREPDSLGATLAPEPETLAAANSTGGPRTSLLRLQGRVGGKAAVFLVDSGATHCYVSRKFVRQHQFPVRLRTTRQVVRLADGTEQGCSEVLPNAEFHIDQYLDSRWSPTVLDLQGFDVVLGKSWLDALGPTVDWQQNTMTIVHRGRTITLQSPCDLRGDQEGLHQLVANEQSWEQWAKPGFSRSGVRINTGRPLGHTILPPSLIDIKSFEELYEAEPENCFMIRTQEVNESASMDDQGEVVVDVQSVLAEFPSVTAGLPSELPPLRAINHHIPLIPGARVPAGRIYPVSTKQEAELKAQLTDLSNRGFIRPSSSPYGAPVLFVRKSDGSSRMCQDYRGLNKISVKNSYPLPRIDQLLDRLHGARVFSKLDLQMGYNQIRINPPDIEKSAFRTRYGLYEYLVMPFGMCNAPATFQRTMNEIFREYLDIFVLVYLDDILIFSRTPAEHLKHLRIVLGVLRKHSFFCKLSKCQFGRSSMGFLGHRVGEFGIQASASKHESISSWPTPGCPTDVRSFLGLANYIRRGVKDFSALSAPLLELTHLSHKWDWGASHQQAFEDLKAACVNSAVVHAPNPSAPFIVTTDASAFATGAILEQEYGGVRYTVAFDSSKFSPSEMNKTAYEKEMMAVLRALRTWRHHLLGERFTLNCDNSAVTFLSNQPQLSPQQARWQQTLSEYTYNIVHIPGRLNVAADALSRRQDLAPIKPRASS